MLPAEWDRVVSLLKYAFQPIVNIQSGHTFGVEALLRNVKAAGFCTIQEVFDRAAQEGCLAELDVRLRKLALASFYEINGSEQMKLFFNLDTRLVNEAKHSAECTEKMCHSAWVHPDSLCFEISEKFPLDHTEEFRRTLDLYRSKGYRIALDDFGSGFSGLKVLYTSEPDYLKIDRFFISGICRDARKKLFVTNIVALAHTLGMKVIAEGVETRKEFYQCRESGCDYVQGFYISYPHLDTATVPLRYPAIEYINRNDRRTTGKDSSFILDNIEKIESFTFPGTSISAVFNFFRRHNENTYIPLVSTMGEPLGIVHEKNLKKYVYSPFGKELLTNRGREHELLSFITRVPCFEATSTLEQIIAVYNHDNMRSEECIIITQNSKYIGVLTAKTLLKAINERALSAARDLNPLSGLPGNRSIARYLKEMLHGRERGELIVAYFDFDNFKPFNDYFGFRVGDRIIKHFSDILKAETGSSGIFAGHVGGDDFFVGIEKQELSRAMQLLKQIKEQFDTDALMYYDRSTQKRGVIDMHDRRGVLRSFPLITVSVAVLAMAKREKVTDDYINRRITVLKKIAKSNTAGIALEVSSFDTCSAGGIQGFKKEKIL
ncbi:MAG: GGDEF domain-containing protein [Fibrobacterota bacterium]